MDLDAVADELYGLAPAEFTSARDARVVEARRAGDRLLADAIKKMRRPTVGAWLVNLLTRQYPDDVAQLLELGTTLRHAQARLAGDDLRRHSAQRHKVIALLVADARHLASDLGQIVSGTTARELETTLEAAVADAGAADAVRAGRLDAPLRYSGFGPVDLARPEVPEAATAAPGPAAPSTTEALSSDAGGGAPTGPHRHQPDDQRYQRRQDAGQALKVAIADAALAQDKVAAQGRRLHDADQRHRSVHHQVVELEQQLQQRRAAEAEAALDLRHQQEASEAAGRALDAARDVVARARDALGDLPPAPP